MSADPEVIELVERMRSIHPEKTDAELASYLQGLAEYLERHRLRAQVDNQRDGGTE